ncbi:secreted protein [Beggiatoa sp. PS]|nr:secreted protein [Beggiatoa sp. PS]
MKTQLMILMFVVSVLLSSCVVAPPEPVTGSRDAYYPQPTEDYYIVKRGDTLSSIARGYGISDYKTIAYWNNLSPPYNLRIGQRLVISPDNQSIQVPGLVTPLPNQPTLGASSNIPRPIYPAYARPGCGVQVLSVTTFPHPCPPSIHQCTGAHYVIKNTSVTTRTVTVEYRYLRQVDVLRSNIQIPPNGLIDGKAYEVTNTVGTQNIIISHCY